MKRKELRILHRRPILEYANAAWYPHTATGINKLNSVQNLAARFICNNFRFNSSVSILILESKVSPLE